MFFSLEELLEATGGRLVNQFRKDGISPGAKKKLTAKEKDKLVATLTSEMKDAASRLDFETAAYLRDRIRALRETK